VRWKSLVYTQRIFLQINWLKNYENRSTFAKVTIKHQGVYFFERQCMLAYKRVNVTRRVFFEIQAWHWTQCTNVWQCRCRDFNYSHTGRLLEMTYASHNLISNNEVPTVGGTMHSWWCKPKLDLELMNIMCFLSVIEYCRIILRRFIFLAARCLLYICFTWPHYTVWQELTEKSETMSLFGFPFLLTARRDPSVEGKYDFFIQVLLLSLINIFVASHFSATNSIENDHFSRQLQQCYTAVNCSSGVKHCHTAFLPPVTCTIYLNACMYPLYHYSVQCMYSLRCAKAVSFGQFDYVKLWFKIWGENTLQKFIIVHP